MATTSDRNTPFPTDFWKDKITITHINPFDTGVDGRVPPFRPEDSKVNNIAEFMKVKQEAIKFDDGKTDWSLVPFEALEGMAEVLTFGAKKYAAWNWQADNGFKWTRVLGSCLRHLFAFMRGEDNDPESGLSHISHAQCNLLFLAHYIRNKNKNSKDDRNVR